MVGNIAVGWQPSNIHGWGVFGANLIRELLRRRSPRPLLLVPPTPDHMDVTDKITFQPLLQAEKQLAQLSAANPPLDMPDTAALFALGNGLEKQPTADQYKGSTNIGFVFFEYTNLPDDILERSAWMDAIIAGSSWNAEHLKSIGFENAHCVLQGVDAERFQPRPKTDKLGDRFVVFSGGKLEVRKGQDIALMAFKKFHERHPDALLLTVWLNPWPQIVADMALSPHVPHAPNTDLGQPTCFMEWGKSLGLPEGAHLDAGFVPNADMPNVFRECDAALFTNRCEGGTNLVAMEAMASGLPTILSANTGHMDVIGEDHCYPLHDQKPSDLPLDGTSHWRDSDIDEAVERLEEIYQNRQQAKAKGEAARVFMTGMTWQVQVDKLISKVAEIADAPPAN